MFIPKLTRVEMSEENKREPPKDFAMAYDKPDDPDNVIIQIPLSKIAYDSTNREYWTMLGYLEDAKSQMAFLIREKRKKAAQKLVIPVPANNGVLKIH